MAREGKGGCLERGGEGNRKEKGGRWRKGDEEDVVTERRTEGVQ